ncbi:MAG TPA: hypothetical protein VJQ46_03025 [Gemmatimonadales bacterium]|nr:hypothetical protein [Gemmatimonadales bacterium]
MAVHMNLRLVPTSFLLVGCALVGRTDPTADTPVGVHSHNASDVDVYLLCGDRNPQWLGTVPKQGAAEYAITRERRLCAVGLNFFLVVQPQKHGYWVGPLRGVRASSYVELVIEKYAGLSFANLQDVAY